MNTTLKTIGVCGAGGTMGAGIAIVVARAGYRTIAFDRSEDALQRSRGQSASFFEKSVERGKMTAEDRDRALASLVSTADPEAMGECDLVIEAVFEDLSAKHALLATLDEVCSEHTIYASNTSTLSITEIASGSKRPQNVTGMHFCLPAQLMKLVEMSPGLLTARETFDTAWQFAKDIGQIPVETSDDPGFILNALLVPFNNDAIRAVEAGVASAADIDKAVKVGLGYKMGPLELIDLVGLDTQVRLCEAFYGITQDPRAAAPPLLRRMVAAGLTGRKSGRGFFAYHDNAIFGA